MYENVVMLGKLSRSVCVSRQMAQNERARLRKRACREDKKKERKTKRRR